MKPEQFARIRAQLGLSQSQLGERLRYKHISQISAFEIGQRPIPPLLKRLMIAYRDLHRLQAKASFDE